MPGSTNMPGAIDTFSAKKTVDLEAALKATERIVVGPTHVNVKGHGATGNGTDNDSTAITNALAAASNGAKVRVPAGNYMVDPGTLTLLSSRHIEGDGADSTWFTLRSDTSGPALDINVSGSQVRGVYGPR